VAALLECGTLLGELSEDNALARGTAEEWAEVAAAQRASQGTMRVLCDLAERFGRAMSVNEVRVHECGIRHISLFLTFHQRRMRQLLLQREGSWEW
jgi:hypothetical protein